MKIIKTFCSKVVHPTVDTNRPHNASHAPPSAVGAARVCCASSSSPSSPSSPSSLRGSLLSPLPLMEYFVVDTIMGYFVVVYGVFCCRNVDTFMGYFVVDTFMGYIFYES